MWDDNFRPRAGCTASSRGRVLTHTLGGAHTHTQGCSKAPLPSFPPFISQETETQRGGTNLPCGLELECHSDLPIFSCRTSILFSLRSQHLTHKAPEGWPTTLERGNLSLRTTDLSLPPVATFPSDLPIRHLHGPRTAPSPLAERCSTPL